MLPRCRSPRRCSKHCNRNKEISIEGVGECFLYTFCVYTPVPRATWCLGFHSVLSSSSAILALTAIGPPSSFSKPPGNVLGAAGWNDMSVLTKHRGGGICSDAELTRSGYVLATTADKRPIAATKQPYDGVSKASYYSLPSPSCHDLTSKNAPCSGVMCLYSSVENTPRMSLSSCTGSP